MNQRAEQAKENMSKDADLVEANVRDDGVATDGEKDRVELLGLGVLALGEGSLAWQSNQGSARGRGDHVAPARKAGGRASLATAHKMNRDGTSKDLGTGNLTETTRRRHTHTHTRRKRANDRAR